MGDKNENPLEKLRNQFFKETGYVRVDPKTSVRPCCADAFEDFDVQTHDAWLVQSPKGIDLQQLVGQQINLPGTCHIGDIQVQATTYSKPQNEAVGYVNSKGEYGLCKLPLTGYVTVSNRLHEAQPDEDADSEFPAVNSLPLELPPLPTFELPVRHPLFGRNYEERIKVPPKIAKELEEADKRNVMTSARLRRDANYYKIRAEILATPTQTLEEKESEVRQSVLTGVKPGFMMKLTGRREQGF